jgi:hypothetical protein
MRQHTAFRVGRTTRCPDFRAALSVITTINDLIPGQRLFVFNGTSARRAPPAVPPRLRARAPEPLCVPELIFLGAGNLGSPRVPVLAAQSLPGGRLASCRAAVPAGPRRSEIPTRPVPGVSGDPGARDDATPRADTLVCVGPRAFRPQGAGSFGGARAIGAVEARLVHTEEAAGSNPASPTSSGSGVRPGQKLLRTDLIRPADGVFPGPARFQLTADPAHVGPRIVCRLTPPQAVKTSQWPGRSPAWAAPACSWDAARARHLAGSDYKITNSNCR